MKGRLYVIKPGTKVVEFTNLDAAPEAATIHDAVGGFFEVVGYFDTFRGETCVAFCNEDGKRDGLPLNLNATAVWEDALAHHHLSLLDAVGNFVDYLVGPVVVVTGDPELLGDL